MLIESLLPLSLTCSALVTTETTLGRCITVHPCMWWARLRKSRCYANIKTSAGIMSAEGSFTFSEASSNPRGPLP